MNSKITVWVSRLTHSDAATRREAIRTIEAFGDPAALPALADVFAKDPDPALRIEAQKAAQKIYYNLHRLQIAYQYVQMEAYDEARPILEDVLKFDPNNIDAWWLSVFIAETPQRKRAALGRVLQLKPDHMLAQLLAERLDQSGANIYGDAPAKASRPILPPKKKRRIRWAYVLFSAIGLVATMFTSLLLIDNLTGGQMFAGFEERLFGEPEADGWVDATNGGLATEDLPEEQRIPITLRRNVGYGTQLGVLDIGEAHQYQFNAVRGDEIIVAINFPNNGNTAVIALELWNPSGGVIAREITDLGFNAGVLSGRALQYNVLQENTFSLVIVSRPGGPAGNYTLIISTFEEMTNTQ
jgi:hypothetical protein